MSWSLKRQIFYIAILVVFSLGFGYLILSPYFEKLPSCTDGVKNGSEKGVDCGGECARACIFEVDRISILWSRAFEVIPGRYNAVAYLENHNKNAVISKIKYKFRFADKDNIYIGKREGETYIPARGKFAVFEPAIGFGNSKPVYSSFEFTETPVWTNVSEDKIDQLKILVGDIKLENEKEKPRLSATIKNDSLFTIPELSVIAILYDESGNAISASRTYIDELKKEEEKNVDFTWPNPFNSSVIAKEIIPMYNVSLVKLK